VFLSPPSSSASLYHLPFVFSPRFLLHPSSPPFQTSASRSSALWFNMRNPCLLCLSPTAFFLINYKAYHILLPFAPTISTRVPSFQPTDSEVRQSPVVPSLGRFSKKAYLYSFSLFCFLPVVFFYEVFPVPIRPVLLPQRATPLIAVSPISMVELQARAFLET